MIEIKLLSSITEIIYDYQTIFKQCGQRVYDGQNELITNDLQFKFNLIWYKLQETLLSISK